MKKVAVDTATALLIMTVIALISVSGISKTAVKTSDIKIGWAVFLIAVILDIIVSIGFYTYLKPEYKSCLRGLHY